MFSSTRINIMYLIDHNVEIIENRLIRGYVHYSKTFHLSMFIQAAFCKFFWFPSTLIPHHQYLLASSSFPSIGPSADSSITPTLAVFTQFQRYFCLTDLIRGEIQNRFSCRKFGG